MQRPVMDPMLFQEAPAPSSAARRRRLVRLAALALWRAVKAAARVLMYDPLHGLGAFRMEDGTPATRLMRGLMYRLAFAPFFIVMIACAIVWTATHPRAATAEVDPSKQGIYYQAVTFVGSDQTRLEGWLASAIDVKIVLSEQDKILRKKYPAVVLVHDFGQRREQMLPYIKPLHDDGFIVLAINLRGGGSSASEGETFGLREGSDVRAAVDMLRRRPFVDPSRVSVIGVGSGATAALLAANADPQINAVVAVRPMCDQQELLYGRIMPRSALLSWLTPLCKWTFEISYGVDAGELDIKNFQSLRSARPVLLMDAATASQDPCDPRTIAVVRNFLASPTISVSKVD